MNLHLMRIILLSIVSVSCVSRQFQTGQARVRQDAQMEAYEPHEFLEQLYQAGRESLTVFTASELEAFFDPDAINALKRGSRSDFERSIYFIEPLESALIEATQSPVYLSKVGYGRIGTGGFVLVGRNLFPEGYFRNKGADRPPMEFLSSQPWFRFDESTSRLVPEKKGSSKAALEQMFRWRGNHPEFTLFRGARSGHHFEVTGYNSDPDKDSLMFFSTPSLNTALVWARPLVLQWTFERQALLEAVSSPTPSVYIGFEYSYPEFAFLKSSDLISKDLSGEPRVLCRKDTDQLAAPETRGALDATGAGEDAVPTCDPRWFRSITSGFPEYLVLAKQATVLKDARVKDASVSDDRIEEGMLYCSVSAGEKLKYSTAKATPDNQIELQLEGLKPEWDCPKMFSSTRIYIDADKLRLDPETSDSRP